MPGSQGQSLGETWAASTFIAFRLRRQGHRRGRRGVGVGTGEKPGSGGERHRLRAGNGPRPSQGQRGRRRRHPATGAGGGRRPGLARPPPNLRGQLEFWRASLTAVPTAAARPGPAEADAGATAMGLLPFLAAGQTHKTKGPYRANIANGHELADPPPGSRRQPGQGLSPARCIPTDWRPSPCAKPTA